MISLDSCPRRSEDVVWRMIDDEVVILTADGREIHTLNKVGSIIWELADGTRSIIEIVRSIYERFDVDFEVAKVDVLEFVAQLADKNLLHILPAGERKGGKDGD
ncbi:PqqD family protein [Methanophagales archaeon]|nr:MAG: PqqD family protein [Methanophagales archaeon]